MSRPASLAEHYRAHREAFLLALELGCTPREAEAELRKRRAAERDAECTRRLAAKMAGEPPVARCDASEWSQPWMMRD